VGVSHERDLRITLNWGLAVEFQLISNMKSQLLTSPWVTLGVGDDAAILRCPDDHEVVITTDLLLDGVHFLTAEHSLQQIARKSLAANVSDIAAMAGEPVAAFVSLGLPRNWSAEQADQLFSELARAAKEFQVVIAGGDTTSWNAPLSINVALYGLLPRTKAICRDGAKIDDIICVSGPLGGSILGRQFTFTPRVHEARWLAENFRPHAMLDISDGLISDLGHILAASGVGAEIHADSVPIAEEARELNGDRTPLEHALSDGEDFELLWTMAPDMFQQLQHAIDRPVDVFPVGRIVAGSGCVIVDRQGQPLSCNTQGYVHHLKP